MESNEFIERKVKVFSLRQVKDIIRYQGIRLFEFDESKDAYCLGIIIDELAVAPSSEENIPKA